MEKSEIGEKIEKHGLGVVVKRTTILKRLILDPIGVVSSLIVLHDILDIQKNILETSLDASLSQLRTAKKLEDRISDLEYRLSDREDEIITLISDLEILRSKVENE